MNLTMYNETFTGTHEPMRMFKLVWFIKDVILILLGIVGFAGNAIIVTMILKYPTLRKKEESIHIIGFLAATDGITGLGSLIIACNYLYLDLFNITSITRAYCICVWFAMGLGVFSSQIMIALTGLERCKAVWNPIKHLGRNHFKFALRSFLFSAGFAVLVNLMRFIGIDPSSQPLSCNISDTVAKWYRIFFGLFALFISLFVNVIYMVMVVIVRKKSVGTNSNNPSSAAVAAKLHRQVQVTKSITIVLGVYCAIWVTPTYVYTALNFLRFSESVLGAMANIVLLGTAASAACNIFIYSFKIPAIKTHLKKLYKGQTVTTPAVHWRADQGVNIGNRRLDPTNTRHK